MKGALRGTFMDLGNILLHISDLCFTNTCLIPRKEKSKGEEVTLFIHALVYKDF